MATKNKLLLALVLRVRPETYEALNKALQKWLLILHCENVQINGPLLKEKARDLANELNIEYF